MLGCAGPLRGVPRRASGGPDVPRRVPRRLRGQPDNTDAVDAALPAFLAGHPEGVALAGRLGTAAFQYLVEPTTLTVNALCTRFLDERSYPVADRGDARAVGGDCFFQATWDRATSALFTALQVNGDA